MIIICGKTIAEVERDLEMAKRAIASGMPYGIGGENLSDVEQAMAMLKGGAVAPITNPNYVAPVECEDEDEIYCPYCGEPYDGDYCEHCGYDPNEDFEDECEDCSDSVKKPWSASTVHHRLDDGCHGIGLSRGHDTQLGTVCADESDLLIPDLLIELMI